jgi:hypothetical protein
VDRQVLLAIPAYLIKMRPAAQVQDRLMENQAMKALSLRVRRFLVSITIGGVALFVGSTRSRGDDVPFVTKESGPFMVLARIFRGVNAEKYARELATELRQEHKLSAYLFREIQRDARADGIAVLVGDVKTPNESEAILKQVTAINPRCLADRPMVHQRSLAYARRTTNPLLQKSELFKKR